MELNNPFAHEEEKKGSILGGILGALLGAAIGAFLWTLIGMLGYIASIVGFVIAFLASKGYDLLKGRQGTLKVIVLIVCVILAVCIGTLGTTIWSIHNEYSALSDVEKKYFYPAETEVIKQVLADSEVQESLVKDSAMGLVFGILGSIGLIMAAKNGSKKTVTPQPDALEQPDARQQPSAADSSVDPQNGDSDTNIQA